MHSPFLIRSVREEDLDDLYRLSKMVYFINLPSEKDEIKEQIRNSINSFSGDIDDKFNRSYIFVLEDLEEKAVVGTSMAIARHGSTKSPHMYFQLVEKQKYSETIHSGLIHKVLQLKFNYDGPTEIGGLVVDPNYRGHEAKIGRQISFARFQFIKMKRRWFKNQIISELMPPLTDNGESLLWEAVGRRFTNLSYPEADKLSRKNKEFITSLFPKGDIFTCLLPGEVRDVMGKVGPETEPVKHMLEKIGFKWREHIDPFDGGPHYWADTDRVSIIQNSRKWTVAKNPLKKANGRSIEVLVGHMVDEEFMCVQTPAECEHGKITLPTSTIETLEIEPKDPVMVTPISY